MGRVSAALASLGMLLVLVGQTADAGVAPDQIWTPAIVTTPVALVTTATTAVIPETSDPDVSAATLTDVSSGRSKRVSWCR